MKKKEGTLTMLASSTELRPHPAAVSTVLGNGEVVLLQTATGDYYSMNETASLIWSMLERRHLTPDEIGTKLATRFDISLTEARVHTDQLIEDLRTKKLLITEEEDAQ